MKRGIFIGRFQPFHLGHMSVVKEMDEAEDLEEIIIGIGTSQSHNTLYNPFTAGERERMIKDSIKTRKPYQIINIPDINDYPRWVSHVKSLCPKFHIVYSGSTITKTLFEERGYEVRGSGHERMVSATEVRQLMIAGGNWQDYVPEGTREVILNVKGVERLRELSGRFQNPGVTADIIIEYKNKGIVLIGRKDEPYKGFWAIPGGFINTGQESIENTAVREAEEETSIKIKEEDLRLLGVYSQPGRDPRGPVVSVVYYTHVDKGEPRANDDAAYLGLFREIPEQMAFDHKKILEDYFKIKNEAIKNNNSSEE